MTPLPHGCGSSARADSSGVAVGTPVSATFSEPVVGSSVNMELRGPGNTQISAKYGVQLLDPNRDPHPNAPLTNSTTYTATVSGARDSANNTMSPVSWSFTTAAPPPPPLTRVPRTDCAGHPAV